jgi:hypothetical protein
MPVRFSSAIFVRIEASDRREISFSVSKTPTPWMAAASKNGAPPGLRAFCSAATGRMLRRSRLLYWNAIGSERGSSPSSSRFCLRFESDSSFGSAAGAWLSATNTRPSTPFRTSRRVAL